MAVEGHRPSPIGRGMSTVIRTVVQGVWLGWKVESNWTNPFVFLTYLIAKPIAGVILVGLVFVIGSSASGMGSREDLFFYVFIGAVFFIYPATMTVSLAYLVHEDRAKYESLKHIYITPASLTPYIVGRGMASAINASVSVAVSLIIGSIIFSNHFSLPLSIDVVRVDYPALVASILLGVAASILLGIILYAINLITFKLQYSLAEYTTGVLFLLSGVVFPTSMLPYPASLIGGALPTTHFLNAVREALAGDHAYTSMAYLLLSTLALAVISLACMKRVESLARMKGTIDRKAEY
ncbi:MAG: ABC transporter permease [Candidatus Nitrosocaldus sp.]|nr:ABC transporter permease [Candidatus Nitrosocaldus sp.]